MQDDVREKDEQEKGTLINALNSSGTILEFQIFSILLERWHNRRNSIFSPSPQPPIPWFVGKHEEERREIDCVAHEDNAWYLLEAKSSAYDWYFIEFEEQELRRARQPRLLLPQMQSDQRIQMTSFPFGSNLTTSVGIEIKRNKEGRISIERATKGNKIYPEGQYYVERSDRGQIIQDACIQIISNIPWIIEWMLQGKKIKQFERIVPIIVTNANLFKISISKKSINHEGALEDIKNIENVPFLSYELDWSLEGASVDSDNLKNQTGTELKSVVITTLSNLLNAMQAAKA